MLNRPEKICYEQPDKDSSPENDLTSHINILIEASKQAIEDLLNNGEIVKGSTRVFKYTEQLQSSVKKRLFIYIGKKIDKWEDFRTKQCSNYCKAIPSQIIPMINELLKIVEQLGLKSITTKDKDKKNRHVIYQPTNNPSNKPKKENPKISGNNEALRTISKYRDYIPSKYHELLLYIGLNSKNEAWTTYEDLEKFKGIKQEALASHIKNVQQYLEILGLELLTMTSKPNQKRYFAVVNKGKGVKLRATFEKEEAARQKKLKLKKKGKRKGDGSKRKPFNNSTTELILTNFKKPNPGDDVYFQDYPTLVDDEEE